VKSVARKRIQGITIELDGETKGLDKALQDVNKRSRDLSSELREVENALKFNPGNVELLAQKQQLLTQQVENTSEKLERLKSVQDQVQQQFNKGEIGADQYRAFQREIIKTESQLDGFKKALASVDDNKALDNLGKDFQDVRKEAGKARDEIKEVGSELGNLVAGAVAGGGIAGAVSQALDTSSLNTKIEISMEVPPESIKSVKEAVNTVSAYGVDAESALEGVRRQWALNADASDEANTKIVKGAATIAAAYEGIDFTELIQEINEISGELNITNEEALGLTNALLKVGFPPEQLDIIAEYGQQLVRAGYSAEEVQAIMAAGVDTGTWNIDNLLDGLKEGRIRLSEFGEEVPKATQDLLANTDISTKQMQEWGQAVAEGGEKGNKAMQEVAKALMNIEDDTTRNALGVEIFGTMWEDQGENITDTILNMNDHLTTAKDNQDQLNDATEKLNADPAVQFKDAIGELKIALEPVLGVIAGVISKIAEWVQNNPQLAATITTIITVLGILMGIFMALTPIITAIATASGALGISMGAIAAPVLIVIGVITALIAIGVALWKNWDTIKEKAGVIFENVKNAIVNAFQVAKDFIVNTWNNIKQFFSNTWNGIKTNATNIFNNIKSAISNAFNAVKKSISTVWNSIKSFLSDLWNGIKNTASSVFNGVKDGIVDAFNGVKDKVTGIWDSIWGTIKRFINKIIDGMNSMIGGLNKISFSVPDWVPGVGGKKFGINIPKIPRLATGGVVSTPTLAMVGDAGLGNPEIVAPEKMLRTIMKETLGELLNNLPQQNNESNRPIILQIDGRTFAQIIGDYTDEDGGKRIRRIERGLA
jgi:phage-related minor tail protein